jgi:hypothetical protein
MTQSIPKVIHCIWIGGGDITKAKSLKGIKSWLKTQPDYEIWIWWDDAHVFSMHGTRDAIRDPALRKFYESDVDPKGQRSAPGRDIRNFRFLREAVKQPLGFVKDPEAQERLGAFQADFKEYRSKHYPDQDDDTVLALYLIHRSQVAFNPIRELASQHPDQIKLCNVRSRKFVPTTVGTGMQWMNRDLFEEEMALRGMFPAAASDVLRYEILYNYGGIYMDVDLELVEELGSLSVEDNLARCAVEDAKAAPRKTWSLPYQRMTKDTHGGKCLYAMNNIVATHARSEFSDVLRKAIRLAYDAMTPGNSRGSQLDAKGNTLQRYWGQVINKATVDMTGPNLVRDIQYCLYREFELTKIPALTVQRLIQALRTYIELWDGKSHEQQQNMDEAQILTFDAFPRFAKIWRDDDPAYSGFWQWVCDHTYFPMEKVNWRTDDARKSDTKAAARQGKSS